MKFFNSGVSSAAVAYLVAAGTFLKFAVKDVAAQVVTNPATNNGTSPGLSTAAQIGIGIGVTAGALICCGLLILARGCAAASGSNSDCKGCDSAARSCCSGGSYSVI